MAFTTLTEEATLIIGWVATGRVAADVLGTSAQGNPLRLLRVGIPPAAGRAVLALTGAQHGGEVSGREALLDLVGRLTTTTDVDELAFLEEHGLLVMPTCNPDGVEIGIRNNSNGVDVNRDHVTLSQAESQAIAEMLHTYRPALVVDLHEGVVGTDDAQLLGPTVPGVDASITARSVNAVASIKLYLTGVGMVGGDWPGADTETILRNTQGLRNGAAVIAECDSTGSESERTAIASAVAEGALVYARTNAVGLVADADQAATNQAAATGPLPLRTVTLDPAPTSYQLTPTQVSQTALHRDLFGVAGSSNVSLAQQSRPVIGYLLDPDAQFAVVAATRVFAPSQGGGVTGIAPVAQAIIRQEVTWLGCNLVSGRIVAELPDITGQVSRVIGRYTSASLTVPIPLGGPGHLPIDLVLQATDPARTMIVAVVNDVPTWAGIVLPRVGSSDADLSAGCVSVEGYLEHRFVQDHTWIQADEAAVIAAGLFGDAGDISGVGLGINMVIDAPATGQLRDRAYLASDHKTVYEALTELMAVENGPEWTIDPDWLDDTHTAVQLIARVRGRIGVASVTPRAVFESAAKSETTYEYAEDHSGDRYANYVLAYSSGEGQDQPVSTPAIDTAALAAGAPIWERHFQPSTSITTQSVLDAHARAELARVRNGARTWKIDARWDTYPRYGVDWALGDDIAWQLQGHRHPDGVAGRGRAVGFELDMRAGRMRPILQEEL